MKKDDSEILGHPIRIEARGAARKERQTFFRCSNFFGPLKECFISAVLWSFDLQHCFAAVLLVYPLPYIYVCISFTRCFYVLFWSLFVGEISIL